MKRKVLNTKELNTLANVLIRKFGKRKSIKIVYNKLGYVECTDSKNCPLCLVYYNGRHLKCEEDKAKKCLYSKLEKCGKHKNTCEVLPCMKIRDLRYESTRRYEKSRTKMYIKLLKIVKSKKIK